MAKLLKEIHTHVRVNAGVDHKAAAILESLSNMVLTPVQKADIVENIHEDFGSDLSRDDFIEHVHSYLENISGFEGVSSYPDHPQVSTLLDTLWQLYKLPSSSFGGAEDEEVQAREIPPELLLKLAKQYFRIDTLETRKSDGLDFHDVAVWNIRDALIAAYAAGQASASPKPSPRAGKWTNPGPT